MSTKKVTRQDLKKPDEFVSFVTKGVEWIRGNVAIVAGAIAIVLVMAVGALAFVQHRSGKAEEASYKYGRAIEELREASASHDQDRAEKIGAALTKLQNVYETYPGTRAADFALLSVGQGNFELKKYEQAANAFETAIDRFEDQPSFKAMALVGAGKTYEAQRNFSKALDYYQRANAIEANPYKEVIKADIGRLKVFEQARTEANAPADAKAIQLPTPEAK